MSQSNFGGNPAFQQDPSSLGPPGRRGKKLRYGGMAALLVAAVMVAALFGICVLPGEEKEEAPPIPTAGEERPLEKVTTRTFQAELLWQIPLSQTDDQGKLTPDSAALPADVALVDGRIFVLDTNNSRLLEVDQAGKVLQVLDVQRDGRLALQAPMAMTAYQGKLYVANSGGGNVIVVNPNGTVERVVAPQVAPGQRPLRPIGIAVAPNGHIFLSDPDNHRVLHLDGEGQAVSSIGSGKRDAGEYGFNTPGGLSLDAEGNLYVVDMLNYTVKKYSPSGQFLLKMGEAGDTEGTFSRPKAIVVDAGGRIFVSDTLLVAVEVFGADGIYVGFVGRKNPEDKKSESLFQAPHGL
ncbi:MAG TPA: NHL repeat-containing protein, partial [Dehalococcoidia bacterium]|nr:NHL repeat-containing protein [Dehalococcoidia bacterium]